MGLFYFGVLNMADLIDLVYIGAKPEKRDTFYGTNLVFPAGVPIPVPADVAAKLLFHKDVWVKAEQYEAVKEQQLAQIKAELEATKQAEQQRLDALEKASLVVDGYGDLGKLTSVKLKTIVESEGLELSMATGEKVTDFARRIRDALKAQSALKAQAEG